MTDKVEEVECVHKWYTRYFEGTYEVICMSCRVPMPPIKISQSAHAKKYWAGR